MSAPVPLTVIEGGLNRARTKGAAAKNTLYDLVNGYVTIGKTVKVRPGTIRKVDLTPGGGIPATVGLVAFQNVFHVFCHQVVTVPAGYVLDVLVNPNDATQAIKKIHFAAPYMGFLYVSAEFNDGTIAHYWLQTNGTWTANTVHFNGDFVSPTVPNGFAFAATRLEKPHTIWSSESVVAVNDIIEPTIYNGFMFKAIAVAGSPHTGSVEPTWPTTENAQIQEFGDFGTTSSAISAAATTTQTPSQSITDRYGNSSVFAGTSQNVTTESSLTASTKVQAWKAGGLYQPGAVTQPSKGQGAFIGAIPNGDFEAGDDGNWIMAVGSNLSIIVGSAYQGTHCMQATLNRQTSRGVMNTFGTVTSGQSVTASAYVNPNNSGANLTINLNLNWYDGADTFLSRTSSAGQQGVGYRKVSVTGNAPAGAVRCRVEIAFATGTVPSFAFADIVAWNLETPVAVSQFLFEAIQGASATAGGTEPVWPVVAGGTVVDGGVTWQAIGTSIITWQALPLMKSGAVEPTWPTTAGLAVSDGNMSWVCADRRIIDPKCPNSKVVAIAASKVFAADKDIIAFCSTNNCLDWSSANDAGYIPFGLQSYGAEPCVALGLYRSNLLAFNSMGYQMWQLDQDPANMAFLDAQPVGCIYSKSGAPVSTDFVFLTAVGYRSIGVAGANSNLEAGSFGKNVDPLVKASIAALAAGDEPRSLFYPGTGQYWGIFSNQAYVLTMDGATPADMSWSRYLFPSSIDYTTIQNGVLFLRSGNLVWQLDEATLIDDSGGANVSFLGTLQWQYLDFGALGFDKELEGIDLVCTGSVTINIGYDQTNLALATPDYVVAGDTLPGGGMLPFPMTAPSFQFRLTFAGATAWEWNALNVYITQVNKT